MDQLNLFPLSALKTEGYAQPEPRWGDTDDTAVETEVEQQAEAA
ncbi:hypothetical protein [Streptomyces prasinopilosus]|nr:hypothetical protein [Streptomyces prasinopilosus]